MIVVPSLRLCVRLASLHAGQWPRFDAFSVFVVRRYAIALDLYV